MHEAFFAPERLLSEGGIDPLLRGLFAMPMKKPKEQQLVNKELTSKLFSRVEEVILLNPFFANSPLIIANLPRF